MGIPHQCDESFGLSSYPNDVLVEAIHQTSVEQLPPVPTKVSKPWMSGQSYTIIANTLRASQDQNYDEVKMLTKDLKRQVKVDKTVWLKELASSGTWEDIRKLRRPRKPAQGRLTKSSGVLVNSDERADTLATYLQDVQWAVRHCNLIGSRPPLWDNLQVQCGPIIPDEIR